MPSWAREILKQWGTLLEISGGLLQYRWMSFRLKKGTPARAGACMVNTPAPGLPIAKIENHYLLT